MEERMSNFDGITTQIKTNGRPAGSKRKWRPIWGHDIITNRVRIMRKTRATLPEVEIVNGDQDGIMVLQSLFHLKSDQEKEPKQYRLKEKLIINNDKKTSIYSYFVFSLYKENLPGIHSLASSSSLTFPVGTKKNN